MDPTGLISQRDWNFWVGSDSTDRAHPDWEAFKQSNREAWSFATSALTGFGDKVAQVAVGAGEAAAVVGNNVAGKIAGLVNAGLALLSKGKPNSAGPPPNQGDAAKHGGDVHNDAVGKRIEDLKQDPEVSNIRKNQQQVDVEGNKAGQNRPDVQYDKSDTHYVEEYDNSAKASKAHGTTIQKNDPNADVTLKLLK